MLPEKLQVVAWVASAVPFVVETTKLVVVGLSVEIFAVALP